MYENGLYIFTRDLRIIDNIGLNVATQQCKHVYTTFIFTPEQVSRNPFKSENAVQFMIESLESLKKAITEKGGKLIILYGDSSKLIKRLIDKLSIKAVFMNQEISPYGRKRFDELKEVCDLSVVVLEEHNDYYLTEPESILTSSGSNYVKFTPYYNKILSEIKSDRISISKPQSPKTYNFAKPHITINDSLTLKEAMTRFGGQGSPKRLVYGGREDGLNKLRSIKQRVSDYEATRNDLEDQTT